MYKKIIKSATCLSTINKVKFNLTIGKYQNIMSFLIDNNILFLSEINLNLPTELLGNGNSHNLLEFLANNNTNNILLLMFIKYFMNLIDLRYDNDYKVNYYIVNNNKWQDMNIIIGLRVPIAPTTTTTTTLLITTTTTTLFTSSINYGRLYNWYSVNDNRNITPAGWHIPTETEFLALIVYLGSGDVAFNKMKEIGTAHWSNPNSEATNESGFSALPGGYEHNNTFLQLGSMCALWSSTQSDTNKAKIYFNGDFNGVLTQGYMTDVMSIRCIRNDNNTGTTVTDIDGNNYTSVTIGTQVWLQQNLAVTHYQNGDPILSDFTGTVGAVVAYNNDESNVYY